MLTHLFESSITIGYFPVAWKYANCVVTPRGGKRDPHAPRPYRAIPLLSNASKVFEKLMARRITRALIQLGALSNAQFGAIENRSAIDALFTITHPASETLVKPGKPRPDRPTSLADDPRGSFNNTDPARLACIMETRQIPSYLARWVRSFTSDWTLAFCFDNNSETPQPYSSGLPHVVGPIPHSRPGATGGTSCYNAHKRAIESQAVTRRFDIHLARVPFYPGHAESPAITRPRT